jgi:mono/diheme cytochrome c family protein
MRVRLKTLLVLLLGLALGVVAAGTIVLYAGFYNVAATHQHLRPTFWLLKTGLTESIQRQAKDIEPPPLGDPALARRGLALYDAQCAQCHGAPGIAPQPFALGLLPVPTNLAHTVRERTPAELYWVVKNGIKMTGMPAWEYRLSDGDLWALVAFLVELPAVAPHDYASRVAALDDKTRAPASDEARTAGDARRGKVALEQYACTTCHSIPGIVGEHAPVGPPLDRIASRQYLSGVIHNSPDNMVRWLRAPQSISPRTAMPDLGVTERDARDMTAYLYTLK